MTGSASETLRRARANPYVGPRPFEPGEKLYGREAEIDELYYLWNAERIVLLHSPSGAGKSSLLQAGLLPRIQKTFDVWGPTRVNMEPPVEGVNRYALAAMQGFEEGVPEHLRRPPEELARQSLAEYVEKRPRRRHAKKNVALLFDQFEEVLTVDPLALEAKRAFFDQLGELLHAPRVFALFVLREDYLAPLDPYARQVPTHFKNRFRIDLLGLEGAREAIVEPARVGGRRFPAVDRLIHDLATMQVQQPDGSFREETGRHVEPVQLQVVCFRLWDAMPAQKLEIDERELERFGDVTRALGAYYAESVARIAGGDEARERAIRDWLGDRLITAGGIRGQVLRGAGESEGLDNDLIDRLRDTHLVRAEERAGATWYELAHDRLIEPVRSDNADWRAEHLSEVQQRAALWERQGRPPGLLVLDGELAAAERWAAQAAAVTEVEERFLDASRKAQAVADQERRQARRIRRLAVVATAVGALALVAGLFAVVQMLEAQRQRREAVTQRQEAEHQREAADHQRQEAERQREEADRQRQTAVREREAAEQARLEAEEQRRIAELNEREAQVQRTAAVTARGQAERARDAAQSERRKAEAERQRAEAQKEIAEEQRALAVTAEQEARRLRLLAEAEALAVRTLAFTDNAHRELAALLALEAYRIDRRWSEAPENGQIYNALRLAVENLGTGGGRVLHAEDAAVRSVVVAPDGRTLAIGDEDGEIRLLELGGAGQGETFDRLGAGVRALAFTPGGDRLAAGSFDGSLRIWRLVGGRREGPRWLSDAGPVIHSLATRPGRDQLASGDAAGRVRLWDLAALGSPTVLTAGSGGTASPVRRLAFSPSGDTLAAAAQARGILVWDLDRSGDEPLVLSDEAGATAVAFSGDGRWLAVGHEGGAIRLRDRRSGGEPIELVGHTARVEELAFHPHRDLLASASLDGSLRLWDAGRPDALPLVLEGHDSWVWSLAFSPDGERLISGSRDQTVHVWTTSSERLAEEICRGLTRNLTRAEWQEHIPAEVPYEATCPVGEDGADGADGQRCGEDRDQGGERLHEGLQLAGGA